MNSAAVSDGQWWRLFTAIFLHANLGHLAENASIGLVLLGLVMGGYGTGVGLLAALLAGAGGNVLAWLVYENHLSLGASGMVMGCLGLLAAQSIPRARERRPGMWKYALAGTAAGLMLFALLGTSPGSDVVAHLGGFVVGFALGVPLALAPRLTHRTAVNLLAGGLFCLLVVLCWWLALSGNPRTSNSVVLPTIATGAPAACFRAMTSTMKTSILIASLGLCAATALMATPVEITIFDGQSGNGATSPWKGTTGLGIANEDNETEPSTYTGDPWDLEALVYDSASSKLSLVGTYDFKNGQRDNNTLYSSGAIFMRAAGSHSWAYAYVLDFNNNTYSLYNNFTTTDPSDIPASAPFSINAATANLLGTGAMDYTTGILDPFGLGLQRQSGTGHNEIDLGLNLLPGDLLDSFDVHYTISCGNDDIEGHYQNVPDGGVTAMLLALGLVPLVFLRRKTPATCASRG